MATAADALLAESEAHEAAEPPVEANPKIGRAAFNYLEPRQAIDGLAYFRRCAACENFVPEAAMTGAVVGARCAKFGAQFSVSDDDTCNLFVPWHAGMPCEAVIAFNALELRKGLPAGVAPGLVGYKPDCKAQCHACRFYDGGEPTMAGTRMGECEAYESLNEKSPNLFDLVKTVHPHGGCSLWQEWATGDEYGG